MGTLTLYKVTCADCEFTCSTNSWQEAKRVRQFHDNWNRDAESAHEVKVTASTFAYRQGHQALLEEVGAVPA